MSKLPLALVLMFCASPALAQNINGNVIPPGSAFTLPTQPNYIFAGPASGVIAGPPSFRPLVAADLNTATPPAIWATLAAQLGAL